MSAQVGGRHRRSPAEARLIVIAVAAAGALIGEAAIGIGMVVAIHNGSAASSGAAAQSSDRPGAFTPVTATTSVRSKQGRVVFTDDFHDPLSGWWVDSASKDLTSAYVAGGYVMASGGTGDWSMKAPYSEPLAQLGMTVTATLKAGAPPDAGFGVDCLRGSGASQVWYEFIVLADSHWYVTLGTGPDSDPSVRTLTEGTLQGSIAPGSVAVTVEGLCTTLGDGKTTRLVLFVDGRQLADITDTAPALPGEGWVGELSVATSDRPTSIVATSFEERDVMRHAP